MVYPETITITGSAWKAGKGSLVLTLQRSAIIALGIKEGDLIEAEIRVVHKKQQKEQREQTEEKGIKISRK